MRPYDTLIWTILHAVPQLPVGLLSECDMSVRLVVFTLTVDQSIQSALLMENWGIDLTV